MTDRIHWPNRFIFILAAIGSAAGLGNLWRFPFATFEHGGASFVLAIIIANIVVGIPLLALEVGLGQMMQRGAPDAFAGVKKGFRYIGWLALIFGFMVLTYYMSVMAWGIDYLASSFTLSWVGDTSGYFFETILGLSEGVTDIGGISWPVFTAFLLAWALVYFSVWKGVRSISKIVVWTATIPFAILAILIIRAVTLPGAAEGIKLFLIPDWGALLNPQLWLAAFSQVFFSLSLAFGIMVGYGSLNPKKQDITKSVIWIASGNFLVSLMSGFVVFGTLGYMANVQGVAITDVVAQGASLAFVTFPEVLALLPAFATVFAVLFFIMFITLAIDSAFSLLEAFVIPFRDRFPNASPKKIALGGALVAGLFGIIFTTKAGLYYLDIVDHFVVNFGLIAVGILEALIVGWFWKGNKLKEFINEHSGISLGVWWDITIKFITPILLFGLFVWGLINEFKEPYGGYPVPALIYLGALPLVLAPILAFLIEKLATRWPKRDI